MVIIRDKFQAFDLNARPKDKLYDREFKFYEIKHLSIFISWFYCWIDKFW
jgi:hypothetical protein